MIARRSFAAFAFLVLSSAAVTGEANDRFDEVFGMEDAAPAVAPTPEEPAGAETPAKTATPEKPAGEAAPAKSVAPAVVPLPRARPARNTSAELRNRNLCIDQVSQATVEDEQGVAFKVTVCKVKSPNSAAAYLAWCSSEQSMIATSTTIKLLKKVCIERNGGYDPPEVPPAPATVDAAAKPPGGD
jgi:hypothetical protein